MANGHGIHTPIHMAPVDEIDQSDIEFLKNRGVPSRQVFNQTRGDLKKIGELLKKGIITTIDDLESWCYGGSLYRQITQKTVNSSTSGYINIMYGKRAWDQVNREHTLFSLLKKVAWGTSGWRVITPEDSNTEQYTTEDGTIPDGEDPTPYELSVTPASIARRTSRTDIVDALSELDDGLSMLEIAKWLDARHKQIINIALLRDAGGSAHNSKGLYSIDRIIGSYSELAYGKSDGSGVIPANYLDVYGLNRDGGASWADSQVLGQAFGSGDRDMLLKYLNNVIRQVRTNAGRIAAGEYVFVTHPDTADVIDQLAATNQRFKELTAKTFIKGGVGGMEILGAQPRDGIEGAMQVATYKGIPIFTDPNVVQDSIGRIYLVNLNHLFLSILMPTRFYKWGGPETTASFNIEAMYRTVGQVVCTNFRKHGKVRDLQEP